MPSFGAACVVQAMVVCVKGISRVQYSAGACSIDKEAGPSCVGRLLDSTGREAGCRPLRIVCELPPPDREPGCWLHLEQQEHEFPHQERRRPPPG